MPTSTDAKRHLAVIPARGGSKRLPRKNVADFFGKPIIAYTIEAARSAAIFDRVLVSTEDAEIAEAAKKYGGEVDTRPAALGSDQSTVVDVCMELISRLEARNERYDTLTVLYATAPLRTAEDIKATFALLSPTTCEFSMAVSAFQQPVAHAMRVAKDGALSLVFPELLKVRASDAGTFVSGNGSTYCVAMDAFKRTHDFYGETMRGHLMPPERSVDIDTADDLALALYYGAKLKLGSL